MKGQIRLVSVSAPSLEGNPLGDSSTRTTPVYLPPGYEEGKARYPVAYFLHGNMGDAFGWTNHSVFQPNVPERIDALITDGKIPELIAVFPDGFTAFGGTQWNNSEATGRYRDCLCEDVVGFVDKSFRTVADPASRALIGKSSGGYGVLAMIRDRPERFGHYAAHSADAYFEYACIPGFPNAVGPITKAGGLEPWFSDFRVRARTTKMRGDDFGVLNVLGNASCYSPNLKAPLSLDLPFELRTGRIREDIWAKWLAQDPVRFVPQSLTQFRSVSSLFIDCGNRDEFFLQYGARQIADALQAGGVAHQYEEFDDGHRSTNYRYDRSLTFFAERLRAR